jgi:DNA-binding NarL/FixJ family response regulator
MATTVLLADDSEIMRKAILHLLRADPDIQVLAQVASFAQTIKLATKLHPQAIVLDLHMSDERKVTPSQLKSCLNGSRLLAMSIWTDDETKSLAEAIGAVVLLDKTKLADELIAAIKYYVTDQDAVRV